MSTTQPIITITISIVTISILRETPAPITIENISEYLNLHIILFYRYQRQ